MKDDTLGILIILGIIGVGLLGGSQNFNKGPVQNGYSPTSYPVSREQQIQDVEYKIKKLEAELQTEQDKITQSKYKGQVYISQLNTSSDPSQEYISIRASNSMSGTVLVTGWTIKSLWTQNNITIPKASYIFFAGQYNSEEPIYLYPGDTLYLISGISPNGASFKLNKCSGYLSQFQSFTPSIQGSCPAPRNEDLSSIPRVVANEACLNYINSFPSCRIQTDSLPANWNPECTEFIINKINYPSCVATHRNDQDFYRDEWRVYLKKSYSLWRNSSETIVLYDSEGKIVDTLKR